MLAALVNYYSISETHVGDFSRDRNIYFPPPFKTSVKAAIYNIVSDEVRSVEFHGLVAGVSGRPSENELVSVKAYGVDVYVLISSVALAIIYFKRVRPLISSAKRYILNSVLTFTTLLLLFLYGLSMKVPVVVGEYVEVLEPVNCIAGLDLLNVCMVDSFEGNAVLYLNADSDIVVDIFSEGDFLDRIPLKSGESLVKRVDANREHKLIISSHEQSIKLVYRRVSLVNLRDEITTLLVTYSPLLPLTATFITSRSK